jgi:hypothetical protein
MGDYSQAADSQAAYAAMPNQGLPQQFMTPEQQKALANALMGLSTQAVKGAAAGGQVQQQQMPMHAAMPTLTIQGGQMFNPMQNYMGGR